MFYEIWSIIQLLVIILFHYNDPISSLSFFKTSIFLVIYFNPESIAILQGTDFLEK